MTNNVQQQLRISFRSYCDTFWNLASMEDEDIEQCRIWWICPDEQWQCDTGQCIDEKWVLDHEWDCADGSDEIDFINRMIIDRNLQVVSFSTLFNRSMERNQALPFSTICNISTEFACFRMDFSHSLTKLAHERLCLNRSHLGNGQIDCYGAIDEPNTIYQ